MLFVTDFPTHSFACGFSTHSESIGYLITIWLSWWLVLFPLSAFPAIRDIELFLLLIVLGHCYLFPVYRCMTCMEVSIHSFFSVSLTLTDNGLPRRIYASWPTQ